MKFVNSQTPATKLAPTVGKRDNKAMVFRLIDTIVTKKKFKDFFCQVGLPLSKLKTFRKHKKSAVVGVRANGFVVEQSPTTALCHSNNLLCHPMS